MPHVLQGGDLANEIILDVAAYSEVETRQELGAYSEEKSSKVDKAKADFLAVQDHACDLLKKAREHFQTVCGIDTPE